MTTVEIQGITAEPVSPTTVVITRVTGRATGAGTSAARVQVAGVSGFAAGGDAPKAWVQVAGLHGFARNPAPIAGQSLLHMWDGERLRQVHPFVWDGSGVSPS